MSHVLVIVNRKESPFYLKDPHAKEQSAKTRDAVCRALQDLGHLPTVVEVGPRLLDSLQRLSPDVVFNLATGYRSKRDQAGIVAMLELSGIPFTGSGSCAHVLGLHKHLSKMAMMLHGILTPRFVVVSDGGSRARAMVEELTMPVIVKPSSEGSSAGISEDSVVTEPKAAVIQVEKMLSQFGPPVLVEEFISGREFTVGLVGYPEPQVLPVEEIVFRSSRLYTYTVKCRDAVEAVCPAQIPPESHLEIEDLAKRTFKAIGCADLARVDMRVSQEGRPYVIEINTLPGLAPGYSEIPRMAQKAGMPFSELISHVLEGALARMPSRTNRLQLAEAVISWQRG